MSDEMMSLRTLLEKSSDADLLREMVGFAAQRLMELEVESLTGAAHGEAHPGPPQSPQRLPRPDLGDPRRGGRAAHPKAAQEQLLPGVSGTAAPGRESPRRGCPGGLRARRVDALGR